MLAFGARSCYNAGMKLTDVHTHSTFSADGITPLADMLARAEELGVAYYGVSEHFDYDYLADGVLVEGKTVPMTDAAAYFACARKLQAERGHGTRLLVGGEFGFTPNARAHAMYADVIARYKPDFVVNSVHTVDGHDAWFAEYFVGKTKETAYRAYLLRVRESLDAPYRYDIVAHLGYASRNAPYPDRAMRYTDYADLLDDILRGIIARDKILEVNSSARGAGDFIPATDVLQRYFALGGRLVSFASDAHGADRICAGRETVVSALRAIGFTHITVPDRGKRHFVEI